MLKKNLFIKKKEMTILRSILLYFVAFAEVLCTITLLNFYNGDRIQFAYIATLPLNMLLVVFDTKLIEKKKICILITTILVLLLGANLWNSYDITKNSIRARLRDQEIGNKIANRVKEYEKESNQRIEKVEYCYDYYYFPYELDIRHSYESSARIISYWSTETALEYYLKRDIIIKENPKLHSKYFHNTEWNFYEEDQIIFDKNTMYICFY